MDAPVVIVGSGAAGYGFLRSMRQYDRLRPITLITAEDGAAYSKAEIAKALAAGSDASALVKATAVQLAHRFDALIRTHARVRSIERNARQLVMDDGETVDYASLVLATGAAYVRPAPLRGTAVDQVLTISGLDDFRYLLSELAGRRRVVLLGGSPAGCEFADNLARAGCNVSLFESGSHLMPGRLPSLCASRLAGRLAGSGVSVMLESGIQRVDQASDELELTTLSGGRIGADVVIALSGRQPRAGLAREAGLVTHHGVVVNNEMRTSDPNVFAVGECAEYAHRVFALAEDIEEGCLAAAAALSGRADRMCWRPRMQCLSLQSCPLVLCEPPPLIAGEWQETSTSGGVEAVFHDSRGNFRGFVLLGETIDRADAFYRRLSR